MARVTVEDCLPQVKSRFQLVLTASDLARKFIRGIADPKVGWENDKATVVALREIAAGHNRFIKEIEEHKETPTSEIKQITDL